MKTQKSHMWDLTANMKLSIRPQAERGQLHGHSNWQDLSITTLSQNCDIPGTL